MIRLSVSNESLEDLKREILPNPKNHNEPFCLSLHDTFYRATVLSRRIIGTINWMDTLLGGLRTDHGGVTPNTYTLNESRDF